MIGQFPIRSTGTSKGHASPRCAAGVAIAMVSALGLLVPMLLVTPVFAQAGDDDALRQFREGRHVLMIRHARAPGNGDPPHFRLGECDTQRNLDDVGRAQARAIGVWLRARGVSRARVYSSQWCRCLETATLLDLGEPIELPALNSFYQRPDERESKLRALREFLDARSDDGLPVVLVTHQVTISAVTGVYPSSGEGVLVGRTDAERLPVHARFLFDE